MVLGEEQRTARLRLNRMNPSIALNVGFSAAAVTSSLSRRPLAGSTSKMAALMASPSGCAAPRPA